MNGPFRPEDQIQQFKAFCLGLMNEPYGLGSQALTIQASIPETESATSIRASEGFGAKIARPRVGLKVRKCDFAGR